MQDRQADERPKLLRASYFGEECEGRLAVIVGIQRLLAELRIPLEDRSQDGVAHEFLGLEEVRERCGLLGRRWDGIITVAIDVQFDSPIRWLRRTHGRIGTV